MKQCRRCGKHPPKKKDELYCKECAKVVLKELYEAGYLQRRPRPTPRKNDKAGPRHCGEGSGSWDNVIKAIEDEQT